MQRRPAPPFAVCNLGVDVGGGGAEVAVRLKVVEEGLELARAILVGPGDHAAAAPQRVVPDGEVLPLRLVL